MAKVINVQDFITKWQNGMNGAAAAYKAGVQSVQTAPGASAAAKADKMLAGVTAAITSGKWANRVSSVSLSDWQSATINKGTANLSAGVAQAAKTKQAAFAKSLADTQAAVASVANMPTDTLQQRIAKSAAYQTARAAAAAQS